MNIRAVSPLQRNESCVGHTKQAQDDHDHVKEVDDDGSPVIPQEVKHLPLQCCYLGWGGLSEYSGGSIAGQQGAE